MRSGRLAVALLLCPSLAWATPQLRCEPGMEAQAASSAVVWLVSGLLVGAPVVVSALVARWYLRRRGLATGGTLRFVDSWVAIGVAALGLCGALAMAVFSLLLLVSGAWVRCV